MTEEGAHNGMPKVGEIIENQHTGLNLLVLRNIYSGPFSDVYVVCDKTKNKKYAMKCERQQGNDRPVLKLDVMVLMATKGLTGFPDFLAAGRTFTYRYCAMQLVGPDLGRLRRTRPDRKFSVSTSLNIMEQTLQRLENLHDAGWLCRDVKAPNFAIGLENEENVIFMLDFGFARNYKDKMGKILPPRAAAALMGTFQYCAVSAHSHRDQCPKDDLESWFYMAVELLTGPLPWAEIDGHKNHKLIGEKKAAIRNEPHKSEFFKKLPKNFEAMLSLIDKTGWYDRPRYDVLKEHIAEVARIQGVTMTEPLDWQTNKKMQAKAAFVGELGESNLASAKLDADTDANTMMDIEFDEPFDTVDSGPKSATLSATNVNPHWTSGSPADSNKSKDSTKKSDKSPNKEGKKSSHDKETDKKEKKNNGNEDSAGEKVFFEYLEGLEIP